MTSDVESLNSEQQEIRTKLRESFLRTISDLIGQSCNIVTYEQSSLKAIFAGWKPDGSEILVEDMMTPASVNINAALLRAPDILALKFEESSTLS